MRSLTTLRRWLPAVLTAVMAICGVVAFEHPASAASRCAGAICLFNNINYDQLGSSNDDLCATSSHVGLAGEPDARLIPPGGENDAVSSAVNHSVRTTLVLYSGVNYTGYRYVLLPGQAWPDFRSLPGENNNPAVYSGANDTISSWKFVCGSVDPSQQADCGPNLLCLFSDPEFYSDGTADTSKPIGGYPCSAGQKWPDLTQVPRPASQWSPSKGTWSYSITSLRNTTIDTVFALYPEANFGGTPVYIGPGQQWNDLRNIPNLNDRISSIAAHCARPTNCPSGMLCLYSHQWFNADLANPTAPRDFIALPRPNCEKIADLRTIARSGGGSWNDVAQSVSADPNGNCAATFLFKDASFSGDRTAYPLDSPSLFFDADPRTGFADPDFPRTLNFQNSISSIG